MRWRALVASVGLLSGAALAQTPEPPPDPDQEFVPWDGGEGREPEPSAPAPAEPAPPPPPPPSDSARAPQRGALDVRAQRPAPREENRTSLYAAPTLGPGRFAFGGMIGFPILGLRAAMGVTQRLDVGVGVDSFFGSMNEVRALARFGFGGDGFWAASLLFEGGAAFFTQPPSQDETGPRWLTGRRNFNGELGIVVSHRGASPQATRLFFDIRYHLAVDTEPFSTSPLGGLPPPVVFGHNVPVRMGSEMPFTRSASFVFMFGFDIHGREVDSRFMPVLAVGLVTG